MSRNQPPGFKTREIHAGVSPDPVTGAILTPIYQSTTFVQESVDQYLSKGYSYTRSGNPTVVALEIASQPLKAEQVLHVSQPAWLRPAR